jgi:hypothetical protein
MPFVYLEPLPPRTTKADVLALLQDVGGLAKSKVGKIDLADRQISIEVPDGWQDRVARALDGARLNERVVRAWSASGATVQGDDHFQKLLRLIDLEGQAELERARERVGRLSADAAEKTGESLVDLVIDDEYAGLGGRFVISLVKRNRTLGLPWTRLGIGSPVLLWPHEVSHQVGFRGVVCERSPQRICVALPDLPDELNDYERWRIDASSDEVTRTRQRTALAQVRSASSGRLAQLRDLTLGERAASYQPLAQCTFFDTALDTSQQEAVRFALAADDLAIVHGPPGTGKTTTVVEIIRQAVARDERVLVCAPSNLAVDNLLERLLAAGEEAVRLGHPARVMPQLREHTLDILVDEHPDVRRAQKLVRGALALQRKAARFTRARPARGERAQMRADARELFADARRLENQAVEQILDRANVVCATSTGVTSDVLGARQFDLVVIDEAGQSTEPPCWIPLTRAQKVVLAGDHFQLPPTVLSSEAAAGGLGISLLERLAALDGGNLCRRLSVQYRMHESIMEFSSRQFYDGQLTAAPEVRSHLLCDLPGVERNLLTEEPVVFIDTAGASYDEEVEPDGESRFNPREARLVVRKVQQLVEAGVSSSDIAVIAPYAAQVRLVRELLADSEVEVDTVDGFQGREKEAVLVSLVRSNAEGDIGFLADIRRTNVALTRARRKLLVIGDSATLAGHPFYSALLEYFESLAAYHTEWEEVE